MRILVCGDFHGKVSVKLRKAVASQRPDIILCVGDLPDTSALRKLIFKHYDGLGKGLSLEDIVGAKRVDRLHKTAIKSMGKVLDFLDSFGVPVVLIWGNSDYVSHKRPFGLDELPVMVKRFKNVTFVMRERSLVFGDTQVLAFSGYRYPVHKGFRDEILKEDSVLAKNVERENAVWRRRLQRLFSRSDNQKRRIFLCHDAISGCMDIVKSDNPMKGKHLGDDLFAEFVRLHKPDFCVHGHFHEYHARRLFDKTVVVNGGPGFDDCFAVIDDKRVRLLKV